MLHASTSDTGARLNIHGLEDACALLGGAHAWVIRHSAGSGQLFSLLGFAMEIDPSLNALLEHSAQNFHESPVTLWRWKDQTLMCASLPALQKDGCTYMLCMLFEGRLEMTSRLAGLVEELRCSMQEQMSRQLAEQRPESAQQPRRRTVSCICCHRIFPYEHRDNESSPKNSRNKPSTVCDNCAVALYNEVLQPQV